MSSSSSSSGGKCRQISLDEIIVATDNFNSSNVIGRSDMGKVYLAKIKLGPDTEITHAAVKRLKEASKDFDREIEIMLKIQHPNIVSLLGYCNEAGQKMLVYEYMENGSLAHYLEKKSRISMSWQLRVSICIDAARGLSHLHAETAEYPKGMIHRDVKPDNILLDKNGVAKISDFGVLKLSRAQENSVMGTKIIGTSSYLAPEYLTYGRVTREMDVYAFGIVLYQVLCLKSPWEEQDEESYFFTSEPDFIGSLARENVDPTIKDEITNGALEIFINIIRKSLKKDPSVRPTMESVVSTLLEVALSLKSKEVESEAKQSEVAATEPKSDHSAGDSYHRGESSEEGKTSEAIVLNDGGDITKVLESQTKSDLSSSSSSSSSEKWHGQILLDKIIEATGDFNKSNVIGKGGEGKVYLAKMKLSPDLEITQVAVKCLKKASEQFDEEIKTMSKIQHPNLVSLLGYCNEAGKKMLVYEYMENGSLAHYLEKKSRISMSWQRSVSICIDAARGLSRLHAKTDEYSKGMIHRDIKPGNILLDKHGVAKISDFGLVKLSKRAQEKSEMGTQLKGTGGYYAPEYVKYHTVTRKIDIYAFGIILYQVLCLKSPWEKEKDEDYFFTGDEDFALLALENADPTIKDEITYDALKMFTKIIGQSMKKDPRKRPTMDGVVSSLEKVALSSKSDDVDQRRSYSSGGWWRFTTGKKKQIA